MKAIVNLLFFTLLFISFTAQSDNMRPASLTIESIDETNFSVVWKVPAKGNKRLKLDLIFDNSVSRTKPKQVSFFNNAYIETWTINRDAGLLGISFMIAGLSKSSTDVLVRIIDSNNKTVTTVLNADKPSYSLAKQASEQTTLTYITLGIEHILIGFDHLLFITCLIFISTTRKKLLLTITGFTLAHSVTLIMAATGVVSIAIVPVEAVIALSIVFLAIEIAKKNKASLSFKYPVLVSSSFGLLHGFGFASVLAEIGLPKDEKIIALLYFNVGVELGQLIFIAALALLFVLTKWLYPPLKVQNLARIISYFSGSIAMIWLINRLALF
ncbi:hypothetical protein CMT41_09350 [Colwellia sp. MT41]|uniref:HupE/UreJ family protein n=1 Tax=Colwellia sp. MT41 TaxID=58049 RepID=UPI000717AE47|nr:HupE/UreJ family protein [Colwellia sp. MT41]ALO34901.1 hypothetical protein CMT41_09350 [Colwellia sp. MT41]